MSINKVNPIVPNDPIVHTNKDNEQQILPYDISGDDREYSFSIENRISNIRISQTACACIENQGINIANYLCNVIKKHNDINYINSINYKDFL